MPGGRSSRQYGICLVIEVRSAYSFRFRCPRNTYPEVKITVMQKKNDHMTIFTLAFGSLLPRVCKTFFFSLGYLPTKDEERTYRPLSSNLWPRFPWQAHIVMAFVIPVIRAKLHVSAIFPLRIIAKATSTQFDIWPLTFDPWPLTPDL